MAAQIITNGIVTGCLLALVGLAFGFVYGGLRILHIALGACYSAAGYFYFVALKVTTGAAGEPGLTQRGLSTLIALVCVVALSCIIEVAIYWPLYRRHASQ